MNKTILIAFLLFSLNFYAQDLPDDFFKGEYEIISNNSWFGEIFEEGPILISGENNFRRFNVTLFPDAFDIEVIVELKFSDGRILLETIESISLSCSPGIDYVLTSAGNSDSTSYDPNASDEFFEIFYTEDSNASCGGPFLSSFTIVKPNLDCLPPSNFQFSNNTTSTVDLSWSHPSFESESFDIVYGEEGFEIENGNVVNVINDNNTTINDLQTDIVYDFYIQTNCEVNQSTLQGPFKYSNFINSDFTLANNGITCECPDAEFGDVGSLTINGIPYTFTKRTETQLRDLINADSFDSQIKLTCTSGVTDMSDFFNGKIEFNQDIGFWDTSNVTSMANMFKNAFEFNQSLNNWNVSNVIDMSGLFSNTRSFNQPLDNWNVSNVTFMGSMFQSNQVFNQDLSSWEVSKVIDMNRMFSGALEFNQPLNNWDVSNVTKMNLMFRFAIKFNQPLDLWNVSSVSVMNSMFSEAYAFNQFIGNWNVSNVTDMSFMFYHSSSFDQPLDDWDVSNVNDMEAMFSLATSFNQSLSNWEVSKVTNMNDMFHHSSSFDQPLNDWDVSNVTSMFSMFNYSSDFNQPLDNWDVSNVTNMNFMFLDASSFNQDISRWCVEQITTEPDLFSLNSPLQEDFKPKWGDDCETLFVSEFENNSFVLYPNPAKESFNIKTSDLSTIDLIKVYTIGGQLINSYKFSKNKLIEIDINNLQPGNYLVIISTTDKKQITKRLIVQ